MADDSGLCLGRSRCISFHLKSYDQLGHLPLTAKPGTGLDLVGGNVAEVLAVKQQYRYKQYWG